MRGWGCTVQAWGGDGGLQRHARQKSAGGGGSFATAGTAGVGGSVEWATSCVIPPGGKGHLAAAPHRTALQHGLRAATLHIPCHLRSNRQMAVPSKPPRSVCPGLPCPLSRSPPARKPPPLGLVERGRQLSLHVCARLHRPRTARTRTGHACMQGKAPIRELEQAGRQASLFPMRQPLVAVVVGEGSGMAGGQWMRRARATPGTS